MLDTSQFTGTENWYRHFTGRVYTDGVKYVAEKAGAYWLIDKIATEATHDFETWKLNVANLTLTVEDGNDNVLRTSKLDYTDFPEPGITIWFIDNTILLPSEY